MNETILQTLLNNQFIKTVDTGVIESLNRAIATVKANLAKRKNQIIAYTLVGLDPQTSESEPVVLEVESIIIKSWPTFKNSTSTNDKATSYVRAVILQALSDLSKDEQHAAIIWLTGRNVLSYYSAQKEKASIAELLTQCGTRFERTSRIDWSLKEPTTRKVEKLSISNSQSKAAVINQEELINHLKAAAIHTSWAASAGGGENPSHQTAGDWNWPKFFAERAGKGLAEVINKVIANEEKTINGLLETLETNINNYFGELHVFLVEAGKTLNQSAIATNKQSQLLWWKQTLYSTTLNVSYRELSKEVLVLLMAVDLSSLVGLTCPESVNYLLRESLRDVLGSDALEKKSFSSWIENISGMHESQRQLLGLLKNTAVGRKSLTSAIANVLLLNTTDSFANDTGIDISLEISGVDLASWIFNDLQATKFSLQK